MIGSDQLKNESKIDLKYLFVFPMAVRHSVQSCFSSSAALCFSPSVRLVLLFFGAARALGLSCLRSKEEGESEEEMRLGSER